MVNAHTDPWGRRRRFNVGGVHVLTPPVPGAMRCVREVKPTMSDWNMHVYGRFQASVGGAASAPALQSIFCSSGTTVGGSMFWMSAAHRRCSRRRRNSFTK